MDRDRHHPTRAVVIDAVAPQPHLLAEAAALIQQGRLVAFPTETVYGLGADALNPAAVARIFAAKGRPASDPLIVHLADLAELTRVAAAVPAHLAALHDLIPGPLTLVLPRHPRVPLAVTAGRATVAVRVPAHAVAVGLIAAAGTPIAAPSANRFGHTSPTTAAHVLDDLAGRIDMLLDGGATRVGIESTVLDLTSDPPTVLRPGGVSLDQLQARLGTVQLATRHPTPPMGDAAGYRSPGQLERHYAPDHPLRLVVGDVPAARQWLHRELTRLHAQGMRVGLLLCDEDCTALHDAVAATGALVESLGSEAAPHRMAQRLYAAMRALDARQPQVILARQVGSGTLALALHDRLARAASGDITRV